MMIFPQAEGLLLINWKELQQKPLTERKHYTHEKGDWVQVELWLYLYTLFSSHVFVA